MKNIKKVFLIPMVILSLVSCGSNDVKEIKLNNENINQYIRYDVESNIRSVTLYWRVVVNNSTKYSYYEYKNTSITFSCIERPSFTIDLNVGGQGSTEYFTVDLTNHMIFGEDISNSLRITAVQGIFCYK